MPGSFIDFFVFCLGACLGSFVNVVAARMPKGLSIVFPRSHCPRCKAPIAAYDNVPVLSYFILRARCRKCRKPISARYPAVEAALGLLCVLLWRRWTDHPLWVFAAAPACAALAAAALIDFDTFLIPDVLSVGLVVLGLAVSPINPILAGRGPWTSLWISLRGAAFGFAICALTAWAGEKAFKKEAMGGGDIKLLAAIGAWSSALGAFDGLLIGSLLGSVYGFILILKGRASRSSPIPFGPFLAAAAVFNFFYLLPPGFPFL